MAVDYPLETETLVLPEKAFYPSAICVVHWQLRNLISSPEPNIILYASRQDIYRLDTVNHTTSHIVSLGFDIRCSASGYGWMCAGGGFEGRIAIINLCPSPEAAEVDAQLPIDFGDRRPAPRNPLPTVRVERLGGDIVNSVSIHKLEGDESAGILDDVVAVLTNNDKTVRVYSLTQQLETAVMELAFLVNHATISPDGNALVAVGDYQQAYFYERLPLGSSKSKPSTERYASSSCTWELVNIVTLHVLKPPALICGYFSTAWSQCGSLCAVASESGYITIFDADRVRAGEGDSAVEAIIPSSRPDSEPGPGAVRAMQFAPQPWGLLIWAEDHGRVCVADLRSSLRIKQVLRLDPDDPALVKIIPKELDSGGPATDPWPNSRSGMEHLPEADLLRRVRRLHTDPTIDSNARALDAAASHLQSSVIALSRRLNSSSERQSGLDRNGLDPHEREVMESLGRYITNASDSNGPRSIHYDRSGPSGARMTIDEERYPDGFTATGNAQTQARRSHTDRAADLRSQAPRTYTNGSDENHSASLIRRSDMQTASGDSSERPYPYGPPRRQASIVISTSTNGSHRPLGNRSANDRSLRHPPLPISASPLGSLRISFRPDGAAASDNRWEATVEELTSVERRTPARGNAVTDFNGLSETERQRRLIRARDRALSLQESQRLNERELSLLRGVSTRWRDGEPAEGVRTAGLVISADGKTLWAGCERGIFEYTINLMERRTFPAFEMR